MKSISSIALLASLASAAPHAKRQLYGNYTLVATTEVSTFDDIDNGVGAIVKRYECDDLPAPYNYMDFNGFQLLDDSAGDLSIQPNSAPGVGIYDGSVSTASGGPQFSVIYPGSPVKYFNLNSMYFACAEYTNQGVVGRPATCEILATGYGMPSGSNDIVSMASTTLTFQPTATPVAKRQTSEQLMEIAVFGTDFSMLQYIDFSTNFGNEEIALLIDDVRYTLYSNDPLPDQSPDATSSSTTTTASSTTTTGIAIVTTTTTTDSTTTTTTESTTTTTTTTASTTTTTAPTTTTPAILPVDTDLTNSITSLLSEVDALTSEVDALTSEVGSLTTELGVLTTSIAALQSIDSSLSGALASATSALAIANGIVPV